MADQLTSLAIRIRKDLNDVLLKKVAPVVVDETIQQEEAIVYSSYDPKIYNRRENGGLSDPNSFESKILPDGSLFVMNTADPSPSVFGTSINPATNTLLTQWITQGEVSDVFGKGIWTEKRDYISATEDSLDSNQRHINAIKAGMIEKGWVVT
jgi:hypothetical protein